VIKSIRNIRAEADAAPSKALRAVILSGSGKEKIVKAGERYIKKLANITEITFIKSKDEVPEEVMSSVVAGAEIFIPLDDIMDYEAEFDRLQKEKKKLEGEVKRVKGKLSNEGFISKAPQKVVDEEKAKQVKYEEMLSKVCERLALVEKKVK
ncbi:MAG: valine--tRNA ligase, partial [Anaerovoracaceae bacterium]